MAHKIANGYPVTLMFESQNGLEGLHSMSEIKSKFEGHKDYNIWLEMTTQSIVIVPNGINPISYIRNFLVYINQISHNKEVLPALYDAGYIPYIIHPHIMAAKPLVPEQCSIMMKAAATKAGAMLKSYNGKYFADSSTSASYNSYWVTRKDAAKIINHATGSKLDVNNPEVTDKITTLQLFDAVFGREY